MELKSAMAIQPIQYQGLLEAVIENSTQQKNHSRRPVYVPKWNDLNFRINVPKQYGLSMDFAGPGLAPCPYCGDAYCPSLGRP